jgi:hypothetical protein
MPVYGFSYYGDFTRAKREREKRAARQAAKWAKIKADFARRRQLVSIPARAG